MYLETRPQKALQIMNYPIEKEKGPANVDDSKDGDKSDDIVVRMRKRRKMMMKYMRKMRRHVLMEIMLQT